MLLSVVQPVLAMPGWMPTPQEMGQAFGEALAEALAEELTKSVMGKDNFEKAYPYGLPPMPSQTTPQEQFGFGVVPQNSAPQRWITVPSKPWWQFW